MSVMTRIEPADDIRTFLPGIGQDEYERRAKLRSMRNAAAAMISRTDCDAARQLAWLCTEYATEAIYAPFDPGMLDEVGKLCARFMITAMHAERLSPMEESK